MGDNTVHEVVGMGIVQIRMYDGMLCTLTDVWHIPTLSRNLISLSTLDLKGYKYFTRGGVLKVTKGSLVVIKGDLKAANLYVLRGSTFTTNDVVALDQSDSTKIWHMRPI